MSNRARRTAWTAPWLGFAGTRAARHELIGSLLLGLYDSDGHLQRTGICASFNRERRKQLLEELAPLRENAREGHPWAEWATPQEGGDGEGRRPGMKSRWNAKKDLSWEPLRIERVCEVSFDHMQGRRFRHATHFKRWRPDKRPSDCTYEQLDVAPTYEVAEIFGAKSTQTEVLSSRRRPSIMAEVRLRRTLLPLFRRMGVIVMHSLLESAAGGLGPLLSQGLLPGLQSWVP